MNEYERNIEIMKDLRSKIDAVLEPTITDSTVKQPDPKKHLYISLVKSALRIVAGFALFAGNIPLAGIMIVVAEILGIAEELV